jgi:hypothetical protein
MAKVTLMVIKKNIPTYNQGSKATGQQCYPAASINLRAGGF